MTRRAIGTSVVRCLMFRVLYNRDGLMRVGNGMEKKTIVQI